MILVNQVVDYVVTIAKDLGPIFGMSIIMLESIIPVLPLSVFIALNVASFGSFFGIILSWISTVLGCTMSFFIFRKLFRNKLNRLIKKKDLNKIKSIMNRIDKISISNLTLLIAIPFSPAFLINIASGLSKISYKKFLVSLLIGKLIMTYFWGYIGSSLLESLTDITVFLKIVFLLIIALVISKVVEKRFNMK